MGVGVSILLIAAGAILTWAVTATVSGVSIQTVGVILLIVGIVGLVISMIFWSSWGGVGGAARSAHLRRRRPGALLDRATDERASKGGLVPVAFHLAGDRQLDGEDRSRRLPSDSTPMRPFMRRTSSREM